MEIEERTENEEKNELGESLRVQKSEWIKEQIRRKREAEDLILEQMIQEQRVIDRMNQDINENLDRTKESRKFNQDFQEKLNSQIYEMNGITEDKLQGMHEYKNAYYRGCAFSLFLLSIVMIAICGILHGFDSQICLFMIACTGVEGALLAQAKGRRSFIGILCKLLYLLILPVMMVIFVCFELQYPEYELFLPYCAMGAVVVLIVGTAAYFLYDPYRQDKKRLRSAKDYIAEVEKIAKKEVRKNQKLRVKEEKKNQKLLLKEEKKNLRIQQKEEKRNQKVAEKEKLKSEGETQEIRSAEPEAKVQEAAVLEETVEKETSKDDAEQKAEYVVMTETEEVEVKESEEQESAEKEMSESEESVETDDPEWKEKIKRWFQNVKEKWTGWIEKIKEKWQAFLMKLKKEE